MMIRINRIFVVNSLGMILDVSEVAVSGIYQLGLGYLNLYINSNIIFSKVTLYIDSIILESLFDEFDERI